LRNPHADEPIGTLQQLYEGRLMPGLQVSTLRNLDRLLPARVVEPGLTVRPLAHGGPLPEICFEEGDGTRDLFDFVSLNRVAGLLVIKNGVVRHEQYELGNHERTRWASMSMAKTITATLIGAAVKGGCIGSLDDRVIEYLPRLSGSAYEDVTLRQVLTMTSGVKWDETYTDPASERRKLLTIQSRQLCGSTLDFMASLPRAAAPGKVWNYNTGETFVLGAVLHAAVGRPLSVYLSECLWAAFGMESSATWWVESPDGIEFGGSGLSATLRDYGRLGLFWLSEGRSGESSTLPESWMKDLGSSIYVDGRVVDYGYMSWPLERAEGTIHEAAFAAIGIFGQHIYVSPRQELVVVVWSALPKPADASPIAWDAFFGAVANALARPAVSEGVG
jgi:CubicO group peptidase (beta-lactamase class C family)